MHGTSPNLVFRCMNMRSEEHTSELQSRPHLVCRLLLEKKKKTMRAARDLVGILPSDSLAVGRSLGCLRNGHRMRTACHHCVNLVHVRFCQLLFIIPNSR